MTLTARERRLERLLALVTRACDWREAFENRSSALRTVTRLFCKQAQNQVLEGSGNLGDEPRGRLRQGVQMLLYEFGSGPLKWRTAGHELVQRRTQRIEVPAWTERLAAGLFGWKIRGRCHRGLFVWRWRT